MSAGGSKGDGGQAAAGVTVTALAGRLGMSRKVLVGHFERGTVPRDALATSPQGGWVVVDAARAEAAIRKALELREATVEGARAELGAEVNFEDPATWPRDVAGLRLVREWWVARHAKRKDDLAAGELVRADAVRRATFGAARLARDELLGLPDRAADDLAAELGVDVSRVRGVLRAAVERALEDLARALEQRAAPGGDECADDQVDDVEPGLGMEGP